MNETGSKPQIRLTIEPGGKKSVMPRPKTVLRLLQELDLEEETAIVARAGKLLTPDRRIWPDDEILVRLAGSKG